MGPVAICDLNVGDLNVCDLVSVYILNGTVDALPRNRIWASGLLAEWPVMVCVGSDQDRTKREASANGCHGSPPSKHGLVDGPTTAR
jgi:hypothetical protein